MNRKNCPYAYGDNVVYASAVFTGGGDGLTVTIPTDLATQRVNAAASATRTGEGVYSLVMAEGSMPPRVTQVICSVEGGAHQAIVTTQYVATTRTVVVTTYTTAGTADDLLTTEQLKLFIVGQDSTN